MGKMILGALMAVVLAIPLAAQASQQSASKNPFAAALRKSYTVNRDFLAKSAEKMPEEFYGMRPGSQPEVRTFGQILGHLINNNYLACSDAKGGKNPGEGKDFEKVTAKADLVKDLNSAFAYCDAVYAALTDASAMQMVEMTMDDGSKVPALRVSRLIFNISHNNEHYGNLVTYMRIKNIVPPSSEPR